MGDTRYVVDDVDYSCIYTNSFNTFTIVCGTLVFAFTIFGNVLILASLCKYREMFKGSLYIFIGNLALTDILIGLIMFLMLLEQTYSRLGESWDFCLAKGLGVVLTFGCTMFTMTFIAVDRFMAVVFPLRHIMKTKRTKMFLVAVAFSWGACFLCWIRPIMEMRRTEPVVCRLSVMFPKRISIAGVATVLVNIVISGILYGIILWKIKATTVEGSSAPRRKFTGKTLVMVLVFVLFVVCWLPFVITTLMLETAAYSNVDHIMCVREYLIMLGYFNSIINWIVYGASNQKFRLAFKRLLTCKRCGDLPDSSYITSTSSTQSQATREPVTRNDTTCIS